jgi:hypothetical protein
MSDIQNQDNQFEEFEESPAGRPQGQPPRNRVFIAAISIIGLIFVIALAILVYTLLNRGTDQAAQVRDQAAQIIAKNTEVAAVATMEQQRMNQAMQTQDALSKITPTLTKTNTPPAVTSTSVLAIATATPQPTATVSADSATKTAAALATSKAGDTKGYPGPGTPGAPGTPVAGPTLGAGTLQPTATALPNTGFAEDFGLPGLFGLAAVLVAVIFMARRARTH